MNHITTAFLNGDLNEEGFGAAKFCDTTRAKSKLRKTIYGLKN